MRDALDPRAGALFGVRTRPRRSPSASRTDLMDLLRFLGRRVLQGGARSARDQHRGVRHVLHRAPQRGPPPGRPPGHGPDRRRCGQAPRPQPARPRPVLELPAGLLHGNLGYSFYSSEPVSSLIASRAPVTISRGGWRSHHLARHRHRHGRPGGAPAPVHGRPFGHCRRPGLLLDATVPARADPVVLFVLPAPSGRDRPVPRQRVRRAAGRTLPVGHST